MTLCYSRARGESHMFEINQRENMKMIDVPKLASLLLLWLLHAPSFAYAESKATLYIYRQNRLFGSTLDAPVYCDRVELVRITNGSLFRVELEPGKHTLISDDNYIAVQAESGQEYFVRVDIASGLIKGRGKLVYVPLNQGKLEIKGLEPFDPINSRRRLEAVKDRNRRIAGILMAAFTLALTGFMSALAELRRCLSRRSP